jgi:hypothetical protein
MVGLDERVVTINVLAVLSGSEGIERLIRPSMILCWPFRSVKHELPALLAIERADVAALSGLVSIYCP